MLARVRNYPKITNKPVSEPLHTLGVLNDQPESLNAFQIPSSPHLTYLKTVIANFR